MQYREDKKNGNKLSVLGLGCMRFPGSLGRPDMDKAEALILQAVEGGVNYLDTAYLYPGSEQVVGTVLAKHSLRDKVFLATKLPQYLCKAPEDLDRYFALQLERLQTETIDYYLMHNITSYSQWENLVALGVEDWLAQKKASGAIRQVGFSYHGTAHEFEPMLDAYDWDFVQLQYNYVNVNFQAGEAGVKLAAARGLSVVVMEPLLGGSLADRLPTAAAAVFEGAKPGSTPAEWGLNWVWDKPEVTLLLSGMSAPDQLSENLRLAGDARPGMFGPEEQAAVARAVEIFNDCYKVPCTGCNYCMPCPKGINIPACFAAYNASFAVGKGKARTQYITSCGSLGEQARFASDCVNCGKCVRHCPQAIRIPEELRAVRRRLQPPGLKTLLPVVRRFMR